jgi:uncharacterized protein (DUF2384 family)
MPTTPLTFWSMTNSDFGRLHQLAKSNTPAFEKNAVVNWMLSESGDIKPKSVREQNVIATRMFFIFNLAREAYGDEKLAKKFLTHKHRKLRTTPLAKLETEWGGREVEKILNSMIYGLPS